MGYPDTPWQQGDILKSEELNAMVPGLSPIGTIIPWALPYAEPTGSPYSNVKNLAPFHLPATGGVYPTDRAPLLSAAMGHQFIETPTPGLPVFIVGSDLDHEPPNQLGYPDSSVGALIVVQDSNDWELQSYGWNGSTNWVRLGHVEQGTILSGTWADLRESATGTDVPDTAVCWIKDDFGHVEILLDDGFCTPDLRGRSPVGSHNIPNDPVLGAETVLGKRQGDWRTKGHSHAVVPNQYAGTALLDGYNNGTINEWTNYSGHPMVTQTTNANGNTLPHGVRHTNITESNGTGPDDSNHTMVAYHHSAYINEDFAAHGAAHQDPQTVVNWLIFAGERISDPEPHPGTGSARSAGEPLRMNVVSTASIIRERMSSPHLTDGDRAMYEQMLSREEDPPAARTATKTTRKRKKS